MCTLLLISLDGGAKWWSCVTGMSPGPVQLALKFVRFLSVTGCPTFMSVGGIILDLTYSAAILLVLSSDTTQSSISALLESTGSTIHLKPSCRIRGSMQQVHALVKSTHSSINFALHSSRNTSGEPYRTWTISEVLSHSWFLCSWSTAITSSLSSSSGFPPSISFLCSA